MSSLTSPLPMIELRPYPDEKSSHAARGTFLSESSHLQLSMLDRRIACISLLLLTSRLGNGGAVSLYLRLFPASREEFCALPLLDLYHLLGPLACARGRF